MRRLPIRLRVTLAFAGVMAIVLIAIGLFLYLRLEAQLDESIDNGLRSRATEVSALARDSDGSLSGSDADPLIELDESFAQILDAGGGVDRLVAAGRRRDRRSPRPQIERAAAGALVLRARPGPRARGRGARARGAGRSARTARS